MGAALDTVTVVNRAPASKICGGVVLEPGVPKRVPLSFLQQFGYDPALHFDFSEMTGAMRSRTEEGRPAFDFHCPFSAVDGYGRHALDLWRGLLALGCEINLRNQGYFIDDAFLPPDARQQR